MHTIDTKTLCLMLYKELSLVIICVHKQCHLPREPVKLHLPVQLIRLIGESLILHLHVLVPVVKVSRFLNCSLTFYFIFHSVRKITFVIMCPHKSWFDIRTSSTNTNRTMLLQCWCLIIRRQMCTTKTCHHRYLSTNPSLYY